jgi:hypothetical protein
VFASAVQPGEVDLPPGEQLRLHSPQPALGPRDGHALAGTHPQQVDPELGEGGQDDDKHLPHRVGRS